MSDPFHVSNGVCQGSVLSSYLFAVYMDDLSCELNKINAGCMVENLKLNHSMMLMIYSYVVFVLVYQGSTNSKYVVAHSIVFNANKSYDISLE